MHIADSQRAWEPMTLWHSFIPAGSAVGDNAWDREAFTLPYRLFQTASSGTLPPSSL